MEKTPVYALGMQEKLISETADLDESLRAFIDCKLTIIHLFSPG